MADYFKFEFEKKILKLFDERKVSDWIRVDRAMSNKSGPANLFLCSFKLNDSSMSFYH